MKKDHGLSSLIFIIMFFLFAAILFAVSGCAQSKYIRLQGKEFSGELSGDPINGQVNAKELLIISAPGKAKKGEEVYEINAGFYANIPSPKQDEK